MTASMTGFGRGSAHLDGISIVVELRSVNSRYLEISARMPRLLAEREADLQARIRHAFERGRISVQVQIEADAVQEPGLQVNVSAARAYRQLLDTLRESAGIDEPVGLQHLLTFSDVFTARVDNEDASERLWSGLVQALDEAVADLQGMRRDEGAALQRDLEERLLVMENALGSVEERAPERIAEARARLLQRLEEVLSDERLNRDRIELEMVLYADKLDVTEECVRLRSHINLFREALASEEPSGRRLNFVVQEMNREINTIGSKANDAAIAQRAVSMKEELEKIREQVQNVE